MPPKHIPPSIGLTAFNCPHCGVLTSQFWSNTYQMEVSTESDTPSVWTTADSNLFADTEEPERSKLSDWIKRASSGEIFFDPTDHRASSMVINLHLSRCMDCDRVAIWRHSNLVWPNHNEAPEPNADLPDDARADFLEAGLVLGSSPRSAAALLRQAVQRLCKNLGEKGRNIDEDIASLVSKGLDPRVQKALDVVRVVGNNAVHPGQIDLKDDRATAEKLFGLVNLIADIMISQPKHIDAMFGDLPEGARKAIEKRDAGNT